MNKVLFKKYKEKFCYENVENNSSVKTLVNIHEFVKIFLYLKLEIFLFFVQDSIFEAIFLTVSNTRL